MKKRIIYLVALLIISISLVSGNVNAYSENSNIVEDMGIEVSAVTYKTESLQPNQNITIVNNNSKSFRVKYSGACQILLYDSNGNAQTAKESKSSGSLSLKKGATVLISNSGTSSINVQGDARYFNTYHKGYGSVYTDYTITAGQSVKFVNNSNKNAKVKITSSSDTYAYIRYNSSKVLSGGKWKKGNTTVTLKQGETLILTNESSNKNMKVKYCQAFLDRSSSEPAYVCKELSVFSKCTIENNSSQNLKFYAQNGAGTKRSYVVKANSSRTMQAESFGVKLYVPNGFMSMH